MGKQWYQVILGKVGRESENQTSAQLSVLRQFPHDSNNLPVWKQVLSKNQNEIILENQIATKAWTFH